MVACVLTKPSSASVEVTVKCDRGGASPGGSVFNPIVVAAHSTADRTAIRSDNMVAAVLRIQFHELIDRTFTFNRPLALLHITVHLAAGRPEVYHSRGYSTGGGNNR